MSPSVQRTIASASRFVRARETSPAVYAVAPEATSLRSTTTVSVMPARVRCQAMLAPRMPPPMTTTSAFVWAFMVSSLPHAAGSPRTVGQADLLDPALDPRASRYASNVVLAKMTNAPAMVHTSGISENTT